MASWLSPPPSPKAAGLTPSSPAPLPYYPPPEHLFYLNTAEAARFIRWDCSDWQPQPAVADADNELASAILETLAANRGKTLYCGLDQSDTWTKRQVYDNAHAHNDRDRTQYDGSQGQGRFRGFTAGQAGWLTDGEHGITGVSPERIFEFPQQQRRRGWKTVTKRLKLAASSERLARSRDGGTSSQYSDLGSYTSPQFGALGQAHRFFCNSGRPGYSSDGNCNGIVWEPLVEAAAERDCAALGYPRAKNANPSGSWQFRHRDPRPAGSPGHVRVFWQVRQYTATCEKKVRVRRSRR